MFEFYITTLLFCSETDDILNTAKIYLYQLDSYTYLNNVLMLRCWSHIRTWTMYLCCAC